MYVESGSLKSRTAGQKGKGQRLKLEVNRAVGFLWSPDNGQQAHVAEGGGIGNNETG